MTDAESPSRKQSSATASGQRQGCCASLLLLLVLRGYGNRPHCCTFLVSILWSVRLVLFCRMLMARSQPYGLSNQRRHRARRAHRGCAHPASRMGTARWAIPPAVLCRSLKCLLLCDAFNRKFYLRILFTPKAIPNEQEKNNS